MLTYIYAFGICFYPKLLFFSFFFLKKNLNKALSRVCWKVMGSLLSKSDQIGGLKRKSLL